MKTGLKDLSKKILASLADTGVPLDVFPKAQSSRFQLALRFMNIQNSIKRNNIRYNLGALYTKPHSYLAKIYGSFLSLNPNHLGNWSITSHLYDTQQLEHEAIHKMIDLYNAKNTHLEGYITSGATEGNIFSAWVGRSYLSHFSDIKRIVLLTTHLTHYSVRKAGNICGIPQHFVPLNPITWGMDKNGLLLCVSRLYKQGIRGYLIPLTIGYTSTGTRDDILEIDQTISIMEKKYPNSHFYVWIDAALNGLIEPFVNTSFSPFFSTRIQTVVVDFHKFGLVPYSAGIILYRKHLRRCIEQPIEYLRVSDNTLLGSRSGAAAASIWAAIHFFGKKGYTKMIQEQMQNKQYFIEQLRKHIPSAKLLNTDKSLTCGVIFSTLKNKRLPKHIEDKYWLHPAITTIQFHPNKIKKHTIYKFFFLPHIRKRIITEFFIECAQYVR